MTNILITGTTRGLGRCLSKDLAHHNVIPHYRNLADRKGGTCLVGNVGGQAILRNLDFLLSEKPLDVFINNAGVHTSGSFEDDELGKLHEQVEVNFKGPLSITQKVYKHMKAKGSGLIVNISSTACKAATPEEHLYAATKKGFDHALKCIQLEAIGTGVYFMDVYVGAMKTDMTRGRKNYDSLMDPREVANTIGVNIDKFLQGDSSYINEMVIRRR